MANDEKADGKSRYDLPIFKKIMETIPLEDLPRFILGVVSQYYLWKMFGKDWKKELAVITNLDATPSLKIDETNTAIFDMVIAEWIEAGWLPR